MEPLPTDDRRSAAEFSEDEVDKEFIDFYLENGLLELPERLEVDRDLFMAYIRAALAVGIIKALEEPVRMHQFVKNAQAEIDRRSE